MSTAQRPALQSLNPNAVAQRSTAAEKQDVSGPVKPTEVAGTASDAVEDLRKANARLEEENRKHAVAAINQQEEIAEWQRAYESLQTEGQELFQTYERKCTMLKQSHKELEEHKALTLAQGKGVVAAEADRNAAVQESEELRVRVKAMSEAAEAAEERFYSIKEEHSRSLARLDEVEVQLRAASFAARAPTGDGVDAAKIVSLESSVATLEATIKELRQAQSVALEGSGAGEDAVSALPQMTPSRAKSAAFLTPGKSKKPAAAPRTPSGFMLEVDCLSPDGLKEHLESLAISNDLLRQELAGIRKERDSQSEELRAAEGRAAAAQEGALPLQAKLRAAAAQVKTLTEARDEAIAEAEAVHRDLAELQDERHLGSHALQVEVDAAKEAAEAANAARGAAVEELEKLRRQLEKQSEATKNAENDMRLMYKRHKKETQEVADKFQAGAYETRYAAGQIRLMVVGCVGANPEPYIQHPGCGQVPGGGLQGAVRGRGGDTITGVLRQLQVKDRAQLITGGLNRFTKN
ncbi:hypothetical protein T484DRAFT_2315140 [Baffinella frigidus]|nr:hypothetical protein T484DRAFT_2315140 [Cryptophyta sp. CCMP2293]